MRIVPALLILLQIIPLRGAEEPRVYEMRTYFANDGKLDALHARFRDHTMALFEKHGMTNIGYWVPAPNPENALVYLVSYPDRAVRRKAWKEFLADPDWKAAYKASIEGGKLVAKIENRFMTPAGYSAPLKIEAQEPPRLFELREYSTREGKLPDIHKRFRDHTCALFQKHGITNIIYFDLMDDQERADDLLVYLIAHKDAEAREASFDAFRKDPAWIAARDASQKTGPILVPKGVKSTLLQPTDYSPLR
ncbi:MAG: NIPSNAP family protein [Akkermansiaceae bacterium]|nr:NIPSNAP family protein [Akkermansiaceae bacterium]